MRVLAIARSEGIFDVPRKKKTLDRSVGPTYDAILADVVGLVDAARHAAVRSTTCSRCAPFTLLIATFSRRRLENLLGVSGKSRQCLDNLQTTTLWFPLPLASRYRGRTMLDYWRCVI